MWIRSSPSPASTILPLVCGGAEGEEEEEEEEVGACRTAAPFAGYQICNASTHMNVKAHVAKS